MSLLTLSGIRSNPQSFAVISLEFISWRNDCDRSSSTFTQVAVTRESCQQSEQQWAYVHMVNISGISGTVWSALLLTQE